MTVTIKRLSRAFAPLAVFACAAAASATQAQPRREPTPTPRATQRRAASAQSAPQPSPQPPAPVPRTSAGTSPQTDPQASQVSVEEADVAITATVTAQSLRFDAVPRVTVEFPGKPQRETAWEAERTNLPRPVQPGVTYRDVGVRLKIVSVFADIDRIVAEALGEVPPSDDGARPNATPPANNATTTERAAATSNTTTANNATAAGDATAADNARPRAAASGAGQRASASRGARARSPRRPR